MLVAVFVFALGAFATNSPFSYADGAGSPEACKTGVQAVKSPTGDEWIYDTKDEDLVVEGVCIMSGAKMFDGNKHSGVLANGTFEDNCYTVEGVGTQVVTVKRIGDEGPNCQGISHVDVLVGEAPEEPEVPVTPLTPTTPTTPAAPGQTLGTTTAVKQPHVQGQQRQVVAPVGAVAAGAGSIAPALSGLAASLIALGAGALRLRKSE